MRIPAPVMTADRKHSEALQAEAGPQSWPVLISDPSR